MELKNVKNLLDKGGVELIKVQLKAAMTSYNIISVIQDGYNLLEFNGGEPEYSIIKDNLDEIKSLPGIEVYIDDDFVSLSFDENASIEDWSTDMVSRFEECVFCYMIYDRGKFSMDHTNRLKLSFINHLASLGFDVEDKGGYSVIYAN